MSKIKFSKNQIESIIEKYKNGQSIASLSKELGNCPATISKLLKDNGIEVINRQNRLNFDLEKDIIPLYNQGISLTKIAKQFNTNRDTLSKHLKLAGIEVINRQNEVRFNEHIFDSIDTEEKAYWLGFIYADGYIDSSPLEENKKSRYNFELSLKGADAEHLHKFNKFMQHNKDNVKISNVKCNGKLCVRCRWGVTNKHLWETLNNYGCIPRKSLILEFPDESIFMESNRYSKGELIKSFIRGYVDGDGSISYAYTNHTKNFISPIISILGTKKFLDSLLYNIKLEYPEVNGHFSLNDKDNNFVTYVLTFSRTESRTLCYYLYANSNIYLDRKYNRAQFFIEGRRSIKEFIELQQTNNGEDCDVDPVINSETKELNHRTA